MNILAKRFSYANVMATIAVFVALGGVGYAAIRLPKNSVGASQLKRNAVTPSKLSRAARARMVAPVGVIGVAAPTGPVGPTGAQGPIGPEGVPGEKKEAGTPALWAVVKYDGKLLDGTAVSALREAGSSGAGHYEVTFARDVSSCAMIATSQVEPELVQTEAAFQKPDAVFVAVEKPDGTPIDRSFSLVVAC